MREPVSVLQQRFEGDKLPVPYVKFLIKFLLEGLEYLHDTCHVIHSDIKSSNILLTFESPSVLSKAVELLAKTGIKPKVDKDGRYFYPSLSDFGFPESFKMAPKLADFGLAYREDRPDALRRVPIQPPQYHAPEVILGVEWSYKADIWNLGCLIWNLMENRELFPKEYTCSPDGRYEAARHLAEMQTLLGPPPPALLKKSMAESSIDWPHPEPNLDDKLCRNPAEYYGGPFFDENGQFEYQALISDDRALSDTITMLEGAEKELFLDMASQMLQWLPERRKSAKELLCHPWLQF